MRTPGELPTGTVTFLFTDIEGSTRLLVALGDRYQPLLDEHARIIRSAVAAHDGLEVNTEGDAFFAVFRAASDAVGCVVDAQHALAAFAWPPDGAIHVRMGLHTGEGRLGGDDYSGIDVNRAARIAAAGHGGQVLLSDATRVLTEGQLPDGTGTRDLGAHRLKDIDAPERLWQLDIDGLPATFPTLRTQDARPNNLPRNATPMVGRAAELEAVRDLLDEVRLVTLTGPGGTGKSRLARTAGWKSLDRYRDGVCFVPLQDARDRHAAVTAIAAAVGVRGLPDRPTEEGLLDELAVREQLLVLDNLEQALDVGPLVVALLDAAPGVRVLATSRSPLRVSGEQEYAVRPLAVPGESADADVESLGRYAAVELFVARARAVKPSFELTAENAAAIGAICARLDGLPLAIELAALRIRVLSPQAILDRLEHSLQLLEGGRRDRPDRQQTLRAAIAWSYDLLAAPEQRLFERLSVFSGGWTIAAAETVCAAAADPPAPVFEGLAALAEDSLVVADEDPATDDPRFSMLNVIRDYADERLTAAGDAELTRSAHARYFTAFVERAEPELAGPDERGWQLRTRLEADNLRAALRWAEDHIEADVALRLAAASSPFWQHWGETDEGLAMVDRALAIPGGEAAGVARARAHEARERLSGGAAGTLPT